MKTHNNNQTRQYETGLFGCVREHPHVGSRQEKGGIGGPGVVGGTRAPRFLLAPSAGHGGLDGTGISTFRPDCCVFMVLGIYLCECCAAVMLLRHIGESYTGVPLLWRRSCLLVARSDRALLLWFLLLLLWRLVVVAVAMPGVSRLRSSSTPLRSGGSVLRIRGRCTRRRALK